MRTRISLFTLLVPSLGATLSCAAISSFGAGCSGGSVHAASDGGAEAGPRDARADAKSDAGPAKRVDARGRTCDLPVDAKGPGGWDVITDYSCTCPLYSPSDEIMAREPPEPLRWRPCPEPGPQGIGCQQLVPELRDGTAVGYSADPDGSFAFDGSTMRPILALKRNPKTGDHQDALVIEADGRVRTLLRNPTPLRSGQTSESCWSAAVSTNGIGGALRLVSDNTSPPRTTEGVFGYVAWTNGGAVRAANDAWTTGLGHGDSTVLGDWLVHYAVGGIITGESLSTGEQVSMIAPSAQPDGKPHIVIPAGRTMFFEVGDGGIATIYSWTPEAGLRPFLRTAADGRPADRDRGDGMIATDGREIVWTHAEQVEPGHLYTYAKRDLMVAPFTADRAQLRPRRLRADPRTGFAPAKTSAVGCGFHATSGASAAGDGSTSDLFVTRLSDGRAWWIRGNAGTRCDATSCDSFEWGNVLGIACEPGKPPEIFARGSVRNDLSTVLRVPIDLTKLGPGLPAD
jgi:hypothetical protein